MRSDVIDDRDSYFPDHPASQLNEHYKRMELIGTFESNFTKSEVSLQNSVSQRLIERKLSTFFIRGSQFICVLIVCSQTY